MKSLVEVSLLLMSAAAIGDDRPAKNPEGVSEKNAQTKFKALDRNKDNALNKLEARRDSALAARFVSVDVNADGFISKAEYMAHATQPPANPPPNR